MRLPKCGLQIYGRWLTALMARWLVAGSEAARHRRIGLCRAGRQLPDSPEGREPSSCPLRRGAARLRGWRRCRAPEAVPFRQGEALFSCDDRPVRLAVAMFIVALAALAALFAAPAQAQTTVGQLVSNTGQPKYESDIRVGTSSTLQYVRAQNFETSDREDGYTLSEVRARLGTVDAGAVPKVSIYPATTGGDLSSSLYVLTNPATVTATRNRAGNPDSPQAVIFLTSITDVMMDYRNVLRTLSRRIRL